MEVRFTSQKVLLPQKQLKLAHLPGPGVLPTAINATMLALVDAGIPVKDFVASASVGLLGQTDPLAGRLNYTCNAFIAVTVLRSQYIFLRDRSERCGVKFRWCRVKHSCS